MRTPTPHPSYFLAEWYRQDLAEAPVGPTIATLAEAAGEVSAEGTPILLLALLAIPSDAMLFGVFSAASPRIVTRTCERAGMSAQRLTPTAAVYFLGGH